MTLQLLDFPTLVKTQASAVRISCEQLLDMSTGSVLRALLEANASVGLWIQWLIAQVLGTTRASTSEGPNLDTWMADFGMSRFPATNAVGAVTFSRVTPGLETVIPVGAIVRAGLGTDDQVFGVVRDESNPTWTGSAYGLSATDMSLQVPVMAERPGSAGNVVAGTVTLLASAIPGIDSVTNILPMSGGLDAETDVALRVRFAGFLDSRNRATGQAIGFAIASVRQGLSYTIAERVDASGAVRPGHFTIAVDDGTGAPTDDLMLQVAKAVDEVRPIGGTFTVRPPLTIPASIRLRAAGSTTALANAQAAVLAYVAGLPIGAPLTVTRLYQVAYGADPAVSNLFEATINGDTVDLVPPIFGLIRPSVVVVTL